MAKASNRVGGLRLWIFALASLVLAGCSTTSVDPYEDFNRSVMSFNDTADKYILKPVAQGYQFILPDPVPNLVANVFSNLGDPYIAFNQLLQGKGRLAASDLGRFVVNSTVGVGGLFDVADGWGMEKHEEDFGQTLGVWGFESGPYLVLPLIGPSGITGIPSAYFASFATPQRYIQHIPTRNTVWATEVISLRQQLLSSEALISGDRYTFIRDAYLQRREYLVNDGVVDDPFLD